MNYRVMIPARGGSKGLPGKNTRPFRGKPLIAWSIENAKAAGYKPHVVTDSSTIASLAYDYGAEIVDEPSELATDEAKLSDVVRFFVEQVGRCHVVYLQPTSPLLAPATITRAVALHKTGNFDTIYSGWRLSAFLRDESGTVVNHIPDDDGHLPFTKEMPPQWVQDSAMYVLSYESIATAAYILHGRIGVVQTDFLRWSDIDTQADWAQAEKLAELWT